MSQVGGLNQVSSKHKIWVARPAPAGADCDQILPVDWIGITTCGRTATNYQLLPGDRIFVNSDCLIKTDVYLARVLAPFERILGITLLGSSTVNSIRTDPNRIGNNNN